MNSNPTVVIGDGWSALGVVGFLVKSDVPVTWITGNHARLIAPAACLEWGPGTQFWSELARRFDIQIGNCSTGSLIREFRNKSFREPAWTQAPTIEDRLSVRDEVLWAPERRFVGALDARFSKTVAEIEEELRKILDSGSFKNLKKIEDNPVVGFKKENENIKSVILGSGEEIDAQKVIYADRWSQLPVLEGLPKPLLFLRKREFMGSVQLCLSHDVPLMSGVTESFFAALPRGSGEKLERNIWGYFLAEGKRSVWTICLSSAEVEDNHEIAKKLRRLKSTLDKVFASVGALPPERTFTSTITDEQVRFEEDLICAEEGLAVGFQQLSELPGISFLTDGYGPSWALHQVGDLLGIVIQTDSQAEDVNLLQSGAV